MELRCPRCTIALSKTAVEWVSACGRCGGVFAARIVGPIGENVIAAAQAASETAAVRAPTTSRVTCPACQRPATRESFRGIEVDRCGEHGVWFDRDEIVHVVKKERPGTIKGLGALASGATDVAEALAAPATRPRAGSHIDLADVGLEAAGSVIESKVEAADEQAWLLVDLVAGLFDDKPATK